MTRILWSILLVAATAAWGWSFVAVNYSVQRWAAMGFLAVRFLLALACLAPFCLGRLTRRTFLVGAGVGVPLAIGFAFQTFGLRYTTSTNSGIITAVAMVLAPLMARVLFGVRAQKITLACLAACVAGLALLASPGGEKLLLGDLLTLGSAVAYGFHIALLSRYSPEHDPAALTFAQLTSCVVLFAAAWPAMEPVTWPTGDVWAIIVITALVATTGAFYVQTQVQRRLSAARTSVILSAEPVFASIFGYWLAGDRLTPIQFAGGAVVIASMIVAEVTAARKKEDAESERRGDAERKTS